MLQMKNATTLATLLSALSLALADAPKKPQPVITRKAA
jgi:hypothetical protein